MYVCIYIYMYIHMGLVKGGFAICVFPLGNCDALGSVFNVQIESMPNC